MLNKTYLTLILTVTIITLGALTGAAQVAPVRGEVKLQKADGTTVPVADAVVEAYRTDIDRGVMPAAKTNRRGEFGFVGFQLGHTYALAVSGTGIGPRVEPNVKPGRENIVIVVTEGDGRKLTEAEVREVVKAAASLPAGGVNEADKKRQAEIEKQNAEIIEKNKRVQADDEAARKAYSDGKAALEAKNYDLAIAKFSEGVAAVPDYVGSTPVLLGGKVIAYKGRGYNYYVQGAGTPDAAGRIEKYNLAKKEYHDALAAYQQAMEVIKKAPAATDPKEQTQRKAIAADLYLNAIEVHRLMAVGQIDTTRTAEAEAIINEYIASEADPAKQATARKTLGDIMRAGGEFDKAIAAYKAVLETKPDDTEVMASLGLSLVGLATTVDPPNKDQMQEGLNYMQRYADSVQILPTDSKQVQEFKQSVKDTVEYLKTEQKLKAQPTKAAPSRRKT